MLIDKGFKMVGFVIMPNHLHFLIYYPNLDKPLNNYISNGKRFMAYEIVKRLKKERKLKILSLLNSGVTVKERLEGKKHRVFNPSFDAKICYGQEFIEQKLDYIHLNPIKGRWNLVDDHHDYFHSSVRFYELNEESDIPLTHYLDIIY